MVDDSGRYDIATADWGLIDKPLKTVSPDDLILTKPFQPPLDSSLCCGT
jgi:hypothetical protein